MTQITAEATARTVVEKEIKRFEEMRDDQDQAIAILREEIVERELLFYEYAGVIYTLRRSEALRDDVTHRHLRSSHR